MVSIWLVISLRFKPAETSSIKLICFHLRRHVECLLCLRHCARCSAYRDSVTLHKSIKASTIIILTLQMKKTDFYLSNTTWLVSDHKFECMWSALTAQSLNHHNNFYIGPHREPCVIQHLQYDYAKMLPYNV